MNNTIEDKLQFRREVFLAIIVAGFASCAAFSNLLFVSNELYPITADAMGHMAKVRYLAESFAQGNFPSWFPHWYTGTTVTQYYPPLSYWILAVVFMVVKNALLAYKINFFLMLFVGGTGVWYFSRKSIGRWCGLFAIIGYCLQPNILRSLFSAGQVAEGPIVALAPWYLLVLLAFVKKPDAKKFLFCTVLCSLMILAHPNTTFMCCLCIAVVLFVFVILRQISFSAFFFAMLSIVFSGVLTAFWSLVGVTGLENPGIPYLLLEAVLTHTATIEWFTSLDSSFFIFGIPISIASILAVFVFVLRKQKNRMEGGEFFGVLFLILLTFITILFSFGLHLPLFEYIPMAESFVPGRILHLTAVSGAMLGAYLLLAIYRYGAEKRILGKLVACLLCVLIMVSTVFFMNPWVVQYPSRSSQEFDEIIAKAELEGNFFDKGRYAFIGAFDCTQTYFPLSHGFNMNDGWNIEGTPHNQEIWDHIIAQGSGSPDYIAKNLIYWNVRLLLLSEEYDEIAEALNKDHRFDYIGDTIDGKFYVSKEESSYFLLDPRETLALGKGAQAMAIKFPWLIYDKRKDICSYSMDELRDYKLIYLCEPEIKNKKAKDEMEARVEALVNEGISVIVEPTINKGYSLFDVVPSAIKKELLPEIVRNEASPIKSKLSISGLDEFGEYSKTLLGLDRPYYQIAQNEGRLVNDIVGTKKVGNGEVLFIGMHLSQYIKPVYVKNWGVPKNENFPIPTKSVEAFYNDLFSSYGVETSFWPEVFPVKKAKWNEKGVAFSYSSEKAEDITISVTYAPRWRVTIDGKPSIVGQRENLITLDLPAGEHDVKLVYGLTKYGKVGYTISLVGMVFLLLFLRFYNKITNWVTELSNRIFHYLQIV